MIFGRNKKTDIVLGLLLGILVVLLVLTLVKVRIQEAYDEKKREEIVKEYKQAVSENDYIVHALGGIDGNTYTNSKEALEKSRENGARFFEADMRRTVDGKVALTHGWEEIDYLERLGVPFEFGNNIMSYDQFKKIKIKGKYTSMGFEDLVKFMKENPDVYVMLDFGKKSSRYTRLVYNAILDVTQDPEVLDRMIVGGHNTSMVRTVKSIYPFKLYNLYWPSVEQRQDEKIDTPEEFLNFCKENKITSLSTSVETYNNEKDTIKYFRDNGLIVYVFTENDEEKAKELLEEVDMVGTDFLLK